MATIVHDNFRNAQLGKPGGTTTTVDFDTDTISVSLLDQTDSGTITASTQTYDEVDAPTVVAGPVNLANKTVGTVGVGVFDADDVTFSSVSGDAADYLVLFKNTGTPANDPLIITWDSATTGLPVTPNGGDITVTWSSSGILQI